MALFKPTYTDKKTGELKTSAVWWDKFNYAGKPIRESAKTTRKTVAGEAEKRRRLELEKDERRHGRREARESHPIRWT